jgi:hypothetical protein
MEKMLQEGYDSDDPNRVYENFISEPNSPRSKEMLLNPKFNNHINKISEVYQMRDKYDNCYHEAKPLHMYDFKKTKMISRTV